MMTLLLPGFAGTGIQFAPLLRELPPEMGAQVICYPPDQPLDYETLAVFVAQFIPPKGPWAMVAESFSGPLAVKLAARHPERLRGLVLVGSFVQCPVRGVSRLGFLVGPVVALRRNAPAFLIRHFVAGPDAAGSLVAASRAAIDSVSGKVLATRLRAVLAADERDALKASKVPLLILSGSKDRLVNPRVIRGLQALRPEARGVILDAPHMVLQHRPVESAAEISRFLSVLTE